GAQEQRRRDIAGAEIEDAREAAGQAEEKRQQFFRDEAARTARMDQEARDAAQQEQDRLQRIERDKPTGHVEFEAEQTKRAGEARAAQPQPAREQAKDAIGIPASAQRRYHEALSQHYDAREPYA